MANSIADALDQLPGAVGQSTDQFLDQIDRINASLERAQRAVDDAVDRMYRQ